MFAHLRLSRGSTILLAALIIALVALPVGASARPAADGPGPRTQVLSEPSSPAPTVVRTVVKEESVRALPIALAGAALIIAIAGSGYAVVRTAPLRRQLRAEH